MEEHANTRTGTAKCAIITEAEVFTNHEATLQVSMHRNLKPR